MAMFLRTSLLTRHVCKHWRSPATWRSVHNFGTTEVPPITSFGQLAPPIWSRVFLIFKLAEGYAPHYIASMLQQSLEATARRYPEMFCEVVPYSHGGSGLKHLPYKDFEPLSVKDFRTSDEMPSYAELEKTRFPQDVFDPEILCPTHLFISRSDQQFVSKVQANFIRGGLILGWSLHHAVTDGVIFSLWANTCANEFRRLQGVEVKDQDDLERDILENMASPQSQDRSETHRNDGPHENPEYTVVQDLDALHGFLNAEKDFEAVLLRFSEGSLKKLRMHAMPKPMSATTTRRRSTNNAINALLWKATTSAKLSSGLIRPDEEAWICLAADGRSAAQPRSSYLHRGCFLSLLQSNMMVKDLVSNKGLAQASNLLQQSLMQRRSKNGGHFTDSIERLVRSQEDPAKIVPTVALKIPGTGLLHTSWIRWNSYEMNWGGVLGNYVRSVRIPNTGLGPGTHVTLPRLSSGSVEVVAAVPKAALDSFRNDPDLNSYAHIG